ncbi:MAG: 3D domain-containing protein [Pyrinomonadaceae bacterium]
MKLLVRGVIVSSIMVLFVAFIYAQTRTETGLSSAKTSQKQFFGSFIPSEAIIDNLVVHPEANDEKAKSKKLVEKTVSSKAAGSRGSFTATAYCLRGRTAMGHGVRRGIIAADPGVLRLGSSVNLGAGSYSGSYLVSDTGARVRGRKIDIWVPSCAEARRFGRRTVTIN